MTIFAGGFMDINLKTFCEMIASNINYDLETVEHVLNCLIKNFITDLDI